MHAAVTNDAKKKDLKAEGHKRMIACTFMDNGNCEKCGVMMKNPHEQHALGNNQCPNLLTGAVDALQSHRWDEACTKDKKNFATLAVATNLGLGCKKCELKLSKCWKKSKVFNWLPSLFRQVCSMKMSHCLHVSSCHFFKLPC